MTSEPAAAMEKPHPVSMPARVKVADQVGYSGTILAGFCGLWFGDGYRFGLFLSLLAFALASREVFPKAKRSIPFWLSIIFLSFIFLRHISSGFELGFELLHSSPNTIDYAASSPLIFLAASIWLNSKRRLGWFMAACGLGGLVWIVSGTDWHYLIEMVRHFDWSSARGRLHDGSVNRVPFIYLALALGMLTVGLGLSLSVVEGRKRKLLASSCLLITALFLFFVYILDARSVYVASIISLPVASIGLLFALQAQTARSENRVRTTRTMIGVAVISLVMAGGVFSLISVGSERFGAAINDVSRMVASPSLLTEGGQEGLEDHTIAARVMLFQRGVQAFLERPLLGWGAGTNHLWVDNYSDFHNWILEVFVAFGLIGGMLFFLNLFYLLVVHIYAERDYPLARYTALFATSLFLAYLSTQIFTTWISSTQGRFFVTLIGTLISIAHTKGWNPSNDNIKPA